MRATIMLFGLALVLAALAASGLVPTFAQEQEGGVRGAFLTTRPKPVEKSSPSNPSGPAVRPSRRRPKAIQAKPSSMEASATIAVKTDTGSSAKTQAKPPNSTGASATIAVKADSAPPPKTQAQRIGLGVTLYTRDANGLSVRVDPTRVFRGGDKVRAVLETNANGYLYIFNTTDGGKPLMIYPNPELDEGGNYIQAHVPIEIPSSVGNEERLRWLTFDKYAGAERLFFVFTREPLPLVPLEDDLINYCKQNESKCPLRPTDELWSQIQTEMNVPLQVAKAERFGKAQTAVEHQASTRGIGLSKDDPEPAVVMMTVSANTAILVAMLELVHK